MKLMLLNGMVMAAASLCAFSALANEASKEGASKENTVDVSKNPLTGNTTVTEEKKSSSEDNTQKTNRTAKRKRKYNKNGQQTKDTVEKEKTTELKNP